jgi:ABC-type multidrug transport system fused ATPase/permease subunit
LILDDCSSALDMITEKKVLKGIKREYPGKTLIIIAHRAESVKDCDEIIYLENGEIAERGTFRQLLRQDGRFAAVYRDQKTSAQNEEEQLAEQQG